MNKIWFIQIDGVREGPFSVAELKRNPRITPDTLVWREGFTKWVPIRKVAELKAVFEDEEPPEDEESKEKISGTPSKGELVLDLRSDPPPYFFWVIVGLLVVFYIIFQMYWFE